MHMHTHMIIISHVHTIYFVAGVVEYSPCFHLSIDIYENSKTSIGIFQKYPVLIAAYSFDSWLQLNLPINYTVSFHIFQQEKTVT